MKTTASCRERASRGARRRDPSILNAFKNDAFARATLGELVRRPARHRDRSAPRIRSGISHAGQRDDYFRTLRDSSDFTYSGHGDGRF